MNGIAWFLAAWLAQGLDLRERDAVLGDLAECGATGPRAVREIAGLLARRQAAAAAVLCAVAFGLAPLATRFGGAAWIQARTYWRHGVRYATGLTAGEEAFAVLCGCAAVLLWSWTSGFALARVAHGPARFHTALYCGAWIAATGLNPPLLLCLAAAQWGLHRGRSVAGMRIAPWMAAVLATATVAAVWVQGWWSAAYQAWVQGL